MKKILFLVLLPPMLCAQKNNALIKKTQKPNIVLIVADYMGYADIESFGHTEIKTPSLIRLASEGIKYTNFYTADPVCSPSRGALLTGMYPAKTGLTHNISKNDTGLTSKYPTIASRLKNAGYVTGLMGKWHLGFSDASSPNENGFETFFGFKDWSIDYYTHRNITNDDGLYYNTKPVISEGYSTDIFTDSAMAFINKNQQQPFFLCLFYNAALPPLQPPGISGDIRNPSNWEKGTRQDYVGVVERMDHEIGKVLDELQKDGLAQNTIVVFTYDHQGEGVVNHGKFSHGFATLWEGGIRVPLIIRYPKLNRKNVTDPRLSINMDLTYTLLTAAGVTPGSDLEGINIFSKDIDTGRSLFWNWNFKGKTQSAVRKGKWKYIIDNGTGLLFNLEKDPGEHNDVGPGLPKIKEDLEKELQQWKDKMKK